MGSDHPSFILPVSSGDTSRSVKILKEEFPFVDFDMIEHDEDALYHRIAGGREADDDVEERGRELLEFIGQRPETNIAVVSGRARSCVSS